LIRTNSQVDIQRDLAEGRLRMAKDLMTQAAEATLRMDANAVELTEHALAELEHAQERLANLYSQEEAKQP